MNAIQIADSFDLYAADHIPDGWPPVQQKQLTEAAFMLRKQHEAILVLRICLKVCLYENINAVDRYSQSIGDTCETLQLSAMRKTVSDAKQALADTEGFVK